MEFGYISTYTTPEVQRYLPGSINAKVIGKSRTLVADKRYVSKISVKSRKDNILSGGYSNTHARGTHFFKRPPPINPDTRNVPRGGSIPRIVDSSGAEYVPFDPSFYTHETPQNGETKNYRDRGDGPDDDDGPNIPPNLTKPRAMNQTIPGAWPFENNIKLEPEDVKPQMSQVKNIYAARSTYPIPPSGSIPNYYGNGVHPEAPALRYIDTLNTGVQTSSVLNSNSGNQTDVAERGSFGTQTSAAESETLGTQTAVAENRNSGDQTESKSLQNNGTQTDGPIPEALEKDLKKSAETVKSLEKDYVKVVEKFLKAEKSNTKRLKQLINPEDVDEFVEEANDRLKGYELIISQERENAKEKETISQETKAAAEGRIKQLEDLLSEILEAERRLDDVDFKGKDRKKMKTSLKKLGSAQREMQRMYINMIERNGRVANTAIGNLRGRLAELVIINDRLRQISGANNVDNQRRVSELQRQQRELRAEIRRIGQRNESNSRRLLKQNAALRALLGPRLNKRKRDDDAGEGSNKRRRDDDNEDDEPAAAPQPPSPPPEPEAPPAPATRRGARIRDNNGYNVRLRQLQRIVAATKSNAVASTNLLLLATPQVRARFENVARKMPGDVIMAILEAEFGNADFGRRPGQ